MPFRACERLLIVALVNFTDNLFLTDLSKEIDAAQLNPDMLVGKYIPNLIAKACEVSRNCARLIYEQTSSPRLDQVLKKWDQGNRVHLNRGRSSHTLSSSSLLRTLA